MAEPNRFYFTVASQLLRELGERLVGRADIALGELVKNAYDADAYHVEITLVPKKRGAKSGGRIEVRDSGHGMTKDEFAAYWMRIGDDRKARERFSPYLSRPFAGSKGVGRIAAQFLSNKLRIETVSIKDPSRKFVGWLDWSEAVEKGDLQEVGVQYVEEAAGPLDYVGTKVILEDLKQEWERKQVANLAHDIWNLEPPYRKRENIGEIKWPEIPPLPPEGGYRGSRKRSQEQGYRRPEDFAIIFHSPFEGAAEEFEKPRRQVMNLWEAKITGTIRKGNPTVTIEFWGKGQHTYGFPKLRGAGPSRVDEASFEILVYDPKGRQRGGLHVGEVRKYLREHGGVQIFDRGFRLPYYGEVENDWLGITYDHARRLSKSDLIPEKFQVPTGMHYMPTYHQVFGFVEINTGDEPNLAISITRDRLEESRALDRLRAVIRASLHWYGNLRMRIHEQQAGKPVKPRRAVLDLEEALRVYKDDMPAGIHRELERVARKTARTVREAEGNASRQLAALSGYATAGVAAIAYHHEVVHQLAEIEDLANELEKTGEAPSPTQMQSLRERILAWATRVRQLRNLFAPYLGEENVQEERRYRAKAIVDAVLSQVATPLERVSIDPPLVEDALRLPRATYVEWVSVLQNVLFNALNALQNSTRPKIRIYSEAEDGVRRIVVEDSGVGVNLSRQGDLFKPFVRGIQLDPTLGELGYGGSGLGLTIVKMIADRRDCRVGFRQPSKGFSTAFVLEWEEQ